MSKQKGNAERKESRSHSTILSTAKTGLKSNRMQIPDSLTVRNIALAPRNVLHMMCVNQEDFEPLRFQDLIKRNLVDAS